MLTGCEQTIDLNSEEEHILAEEMSDLVLSYDKGYQEYQTKSKVDIDEQDNDIEVEDNIVEQIVDEEIEKSLLESINHYSWDYSKNVKVKLVAYDIVDDLPENKNNYYYVGPISDSSSNKGILRLSFNVINHTDKEVDFRTLDSDLEFSLKKGNTAYYPLITFLPNDIQFMDIKLAAKDEQVMVLLYSVPENIDLDEVMFTIEDSSSEQSKVSKHTLK